MRKVGVNKELQAGANAKSGDRVKVSLQLDEGKRTVEVPDELQLAFKKDKAARILKAVGSLKAGVKRPR